MPSITDLERVLHNIRVKLYPNYLPQAKGAYIARTDNDKVLGFEDVCNTLVNRKGYKHDIETVTECVGAYLDEEAYQLCDGFAVNNGYYYIYPNIGGTFDSANEVHDHKKHPIGFRFSVRKKFRDIYKNITVTVDGLAETNGWIDEFTDQEENSVNTLYIAGNMFSIHGHKIKIAGDNSDNGVYFVPDGDPAHAVKADRIAENTASHVTGICPDTHNTRNRLEIRTQFTGAGDRFLKEPRVITAPFILEQG